MAPITHAFRKQRKEYEKARHAALVEARKGGIWRKKTAWLYCAIEGTFIDLFFIGHAHEQRTTIRITAKPLKLDSLFWEICGLPENEREPLSLRANGVFVCRGLRILEETIEDDADPAVSAAQLLSLADSGAEAAMHRMRSIEFSRLLEIYAEENDISVHARFGPTYLMALILDRRTDDALTLIQEQRMGATKSKVNFVVHAAGPDDRRDFYDLALAYIATDR